MSVVTAGDRAILTRSENISLFGVLLSSEVLIPEGSTVDLTVGAAVFPDQNILLIARGKVLRAHSKPSGKFAVAIECDHPFELTKQKPDVPRAGSC